MLEQACETERVQILGQRRGPNGQAACMALNKWMLRFPGGNKQSRVRLHCTVQNGSKVKTYSDLFLDSPI